LPIEPRRRCTASVSSACFGFDGSGGFGGEVRHRGGQGGDALIKMRGGVCQRKCLRLHCAGALGHFIDALGGFPGTGFPVAHFTLGRAKARLIVSNGAVQSGGFGAQLGDAGAGGFGPALEGGDLPDGLAAIGQGKAGCVRGAGFCLCLGDFALHPFQPFADFGAARGKPFERGGSGIHIARGQAGAIVCLGLCTATGIGGSAGGVHAGLSLCRIGARRVHAGACPIAFGLQRHQPVEADEPFGSGRTLIGGDIAIPAAQLAVPRYDPLANRKRRTVIIVDHADLSQTPGELFRRFDMGGKGGGTGWQAGIAGQGICATPEARARCAHACIQIIAQSCRKRAFIAGRGLDLVEQAIAAGVGCHGLFERSRFAVERGERGLGCRERGLRSIARRLGGIALGIGPGNLRLRGLHIGLGLRQRGPGGGQSRLKRRIIP
jgi:hypothetical protein